MTPQELIQITGQHLLFLGISTYGWSMGQFRQAAQFARAHGVDCLLVKTHDGTNAWYDNIGGFSAVRQTILNEGVGAIPYTYSYGDTYGALDAEINILIQLMQEYGIVCMDAEAEWNFESAWATQLCSHMQGMQGAFLVSTWADPSLQGWEGVIQALAPCTTVFMPQQYDNFLAGFWQEFGANGATWLQPTINLDQSFGPNDPVAIASASYGRQDTAISVWYYDTAVQNPSLLDAVYAAFPKSSGGQQPMQGLYGPNSQDFNDYFTVDANGNWICKSTNAVIIGGNKGLYAQLSIDGNTLPAIGLPLQNEQYHTDSDNYSWSSQQFERATMVYDPGHKYDNVPGQGDSYLAHVNPPQVQTVVAVPMDLHTAIQACVDVEAKFPVQG